MPTTAARPSAGAGSGALAHRRAHGSRGDVTWAAPQLARGSAETARPGYSTVSADEYADVPTVLEAKVKLLAAMVRAASRAVAYTGAGISTASGVPDYATKAEGSMAAITKVVSPYNAQPTKAHRVLVAMHKRGLLPRWVQQNHDGLPQKAGLPQHAINEIHGSWWDPSNPVVKMSGSLRPDLFEDMLQIEGTADLCLALGTSLSGMNADRLATACGKRRLDEGRGEGLVIVGLQQTTLDDVASLRIFGRLDHVFTLLERELGQAGTGGGGDGGDGKRSLPDSETSAPGASGASGVSLSTSTSGVSLSTSTSTSGTSTSGTSTSGSASEERWDVSPTAAEGGAGVLYAPDVPADQYGANVFQSRYAGDGTKLADEAAATVLDLREDAWVRVVGGPYAGSDAQVTGRHKEGHYELRVRVDMSKHRTGPPRPNARPFFAQVPMKLGLWWVEAAVKGAVANFPIGPLPAGATPPE